RATRRIRLSCTAGEGGRSGASSGKGTGAAVESDPHIKPVREIPFELCAQDLLRGGFDVILDPLELEPLGLAVVERVARPVVVIAGLPHGPDAHDVLASGLELEVDSGQLLDRGRRECEYFAEVGMPDERDVTELIP